MHVCPIRRCICSLYFSNMQDFLCVSLCISKGPGIVTGILLSLSATLLISPALSLLQMTCGAFLLYSVHVVPQYWVSRLSRPICPTYADLTNLTVCLTVFLSVFLLNFVISCFVCHNYLKAKPSVCNLSSLYWTSWWSRATFWLRWTNGKTQQDTLSDISADKLRTNRKASRHTHTRALVKLCMVLNLWEPSLWQRPS